MKHKLISTDTQVFKVGEAYPIECTLGLPSKYFRKPISHEEDPSRKFAVGRQLEDGQEDQFSGYDICIIGLKVVTKMYEETQG